MKEEIEGLLETLENEHLCRKQYKLLEDYINNLQSQLKEKEEVIKEAREYVEELYDNTDDTTCYDIDKHRKDYLLEILSKGENK